MEFNSTSFMFFFPIVVVFYFVMPAKLRQFWLLAASYFFYMSWNVGYAALIAGSTLITYISGIVIEECKFRKKEGGRKAALLLCLGINLGILFLFKYADFMAASIDKLLGMMHQDPAGVRLHLLLPVGISFYTFQALGYTIDVYRGEVEAERNLVRYALFVSFFPQLVAGPIERSKNLLSQIRNIKKGGGGSGFLRIG